MIAPAIAAAAGLCLSVCGAERSAPAQAQRAASAQASPIPARSPLRTGGCPDAARPLSRPEDGEFRPWVAWKYRYLLASLQLAECPREQLEQLLTARERLVGRADPGGSPAELGDIDRSLRELIPDGHAALYEALRGSDAVQRQLDDYAGGIENVAPLGEAQKRALLLAKLERKRQFESAMKEAGLERASLPTDQRMHLLAVVRQELDRYRDDFLVDASEVLDEEQLGFLSNYETTEFEQESERLEIAINAK